VALTLSGTVRLQDLLTHLYVLIPVLDNEKHYWVANDEIEKLLKRGEGWLPQHPERDLIVSRYLKRQRHLTREALSRLLADDAPSGKMDGVTLESEVVERAPTLHTQRLQTVFSVIKATGAKRVSNHRNQREDRSFERDGAQSRSTGVGFGGDATSVHGSPSKVSIRRLLSRLRLFQPVRPELHPRRGGRAPASSASFPRLPSWSR
jgi:hypothetical protein